MREGMEMISVEAVGKQPAPKCVSLLGFRGGPTVRVFIGKNKEPYMLPRDFLCAHSEYFRGCFMDNFKEGEEQTLHLTYEVTKTFEYVLQWISTQDVVLDQYDEMRVNFPGTEAGQSRFDIKEYLQFLIAADRYSVSPSPVAHICDKIRKLFIARPEDVLLDGAMIEEAWTSFPNGHAIRELFLQACVADYVTTRVAPDRDTENQTIKKFILETQLHSAPGFATDLLGAAVDFLWKDTSKVTYSLKSASSGRGLAIRDPVTDVVRAISGEPVDPDRIIQTSKW